MRIPFPLVRKIFSGVERRSWESIRGMGSRGDAEHTFPKPLYGNLFKISLEPWPEAKIQREVKRKATQSSLSFACSPYVWVPIAPANAT